MTNRPPFAAQFVAGLLLAGGLASQPALAERKPAPETGQREAVSAVQGGERMNMVIIYGDDKCPESKDTITVCARKAESERYRIPAPFRDGPKGPQNEAWNNRVMAYERIGATGTQSCSPVGAGGWTGCAGQFINNYYAEKKQQTDVHFSQMIEAERAKRAASVDTVAARQQADVEEQEREIDARKKKEAEEAAKAKAKPAPTPAP